MVPSQLVQQLSEALDHKQIEAVLELLTENCRFQASNSDPIYGKEAIGVTLDSFFKSVRGTQHQTTDWFVSENHLAIRGWVTYTRLDTSTLRIPFCDILLLQDGKIADYQIYIDWSDLF